MKTVLAFLFLVVSVALAVERPMDPLPTACCVSFMKRPIPLNLLKSFEYTSGRCSPSAVVFLTKRDRKICADPSEPWVQDRIRALGPP
ncbi:C-C motif chemokine 4-like [Notechis scutatus]|uniref:C-C motif chemokine 4-like n=1 Tax=Notechis scutatus TaxID=8663 RepID=A0A6J1W050_9SAUR|nr:C-C motif chemokine 4-like [Notechis scutatus]